MKQRGFAWVSLIVYGLMAAAIVSVVVGVYLSIKKKGYVEAEEKYKPKLEAALRERDNVRKKYDDFAADVKAKGEAQARRVAEIDAENAKREAERKAAYDKRIGALVADNQRLVDRVRQHFGAGADRDSLPMSGDASSAGAPGRGSADDVPDLRRALEGLTRDCAVTTSLFLECRDAWKGIAR